MNSFFRNKILVSIFIISALFYFVPIRSAHAGTVVTLPLTIVNVVLNAPTAILEIGLGVVTGNSFLSSDGNCRLDNVSSTFFAIYAGECSSGSGSGNVFNNASCLNISKPASIGAGQQFFANVTMQNTGTKVWNSDASPHALGSQNPQDNGTWGLGRVGLPTEPISPGQNVTFGFTATAPTVPGTYPFDWKMVEDYVEWFGQTCQSTMVVNLLPPSSAPSNLSASCPSPGNSAALSWSPVAGATIYAVRVNNLANGWNGDCNNPLPGDSCPDTSATSQTIATSPGASYDWWVHGCNSAGCGPATGGNFTCSVPPPGNFNLNLGGSVACNYVPLSWTSSSGALAYRILRGSPRVDITPYPYTALNFTDSTVSQNITYPYQIEAYNSGGTNRSNTITITTPYCPPTVNFSTNSTSLFQGQSVTLSWAAYYVTSCLASGAWSGSKPTSGSEVVVPLPPPSVTYTLTCSGPGGSDTKSVTINIAPLALPDWKEVIPR